MFAGGQLGPRSVDYMSGRGVAVSEIDQSLKPKKVNEYHERNFSNAKTKQFVDSTSVPLGENIRSSSLSKKEIKSPNVYYMKTEPMNRTSCSVGSEHTMEKYWNNDLHLIKEENQLKQAENRDKNFEVHIDLQPMKKNGGKKPIGMESTTSSQFKLYFKDRSLDNSIEVQEREINF